MQCARHPSVETGLSCTRCGTPICPKCAVNAVIGFHCPKCAKEGTSPLVKVAPWRAALTFVALTIASTIAGIVLQGIGFFLFFVAPVIGGFLGEVVKRASGFKFGRTVEVITVAGLLSGFAISVAATGVWRSYMHNPVSAVFFVIGAFLAAGAAISRVR